MLNTPKNYLDTSNLKHPVLIVIIDTEEEFDWNQSLDRANNSVKNIAHQEKMQEIFAKYDIKPTYVIDYPVASQLESITPLKALYDKGLCDIGAHLHPWVTPPMTEEVNNKNSFPGNLSYEQEYAKLKTLTETITENFGCKPTIYKAGRYGVGNNTTDILNKLGYSIDCSVVPNSDFTTTQGPNFSKIKSCQPYTFANNQILEVPLTVDYVGHLAKAGPQFYQMTQQDRLVKLKAPGILSKLGLFERIRLSPEGQSIDELKRLTISMLKQQNKVFCLTYHSSSLMIGGSPYVNNVSELTLFLDTIDQYLAFFTNTLKGQFTDLNTLKNNATLIQ